MDMSKKSRLKRNQPAPRRFPWPWLVVVGALLLIAGGLVVWNSSSRRSEVPPEVVGAPRLAVDQTMVDEGYMQYNVPVRTLFRLSNVGDQPLKILDTKVELVEGC
jgi:hypothetical protein